MSEELQEVKYYELMSYNSSKEAIKTNAEQTIRSIVATGFYLKHIRNKEMYTVDGYTNIYDLAKDEFGISRSEVNKYMQINDKFSVDGNSPILLEQYRGFKKSILQEMLYLTDEQLEQVTVGTTVAQIREIRKPEEVVSTSKQEPKVCKWDGKSNCVAVCNTGADCCNECNEHGSCNTECGWQEERIPKQEPYWKKNVIPMPQRDECIEQLALYLLRCHFNWFAADTFNRVLHVINSEKEYKNEFTKPNSTWYVKMPNGELYHFNLFEDIIQVYSSSEHLGYIEWFYLCAAVQRKYNTVAFERSSQQLEVNDQPETVNAKPDVVDKEHEIVNDVDESAIKTNENVIEEPESVSTLPSDECIECLLRGNKDAGILECHPENGEHKCFSGPDSPDEMEPDYVETVEADIVQMVPENNRFKGIDIGMVDTAGDPIHEGDIVLHNGDKYHVHWYQKAARFVAEAVERKYRHADMEEWPMHWIDECTVLYSIYGEELDKVQEEPEPVQSEPVQPELPILKNNDQRKDFIDAYETWPIWIDQKETGERYYRYNLTDKIAMVVKVSWKHSYQGYKETKEYEHGAEQYYLIGIKAEWHQTGMTYTEDVSRTFYECSSNKSALVDYLKYFQKKGA